MVKIYPAQEIKECRQCPDYDKARVCVEKGMAIPTNIKIPKWCPLPKKIEAKLDIKKSDDNKLHIIYSPDQDQFLEAGKEYEFVFEAKKKK